MNSPTPTETSGFDIVSGARLAHVLHDAGAGSPIVVMAHGFKSTKIGPSRYFVPLARKLADRGISTYRFDQAGSGDSEGLFDDSSFTGWVAAITEIASTFASSERPVALLGQSMGGSATMTATPALDGLLRCVALWSPGPMLDRLERVEFDGDWMEEDGQRVNANFWRDAAAIDFLRDYAALDVPAYIVFGTADDLILEREMRAVESAARPGDTVRVIEGMPHSAWPYPLREEIIDETAAFLARHLST